MHKMRSESCDRLFQTILNLQNIDECYAYFEDLCTIKELQSMAQRLEVAARLDAGQNYNAVCDRTGASTATISRVSKCCEYGTGGYRTVIDRLSGEENP